MPDYEYIGDDWEYLGPRQNEVIDFDALKKKKNRTNEEDYEVERLNKLFKK